MTYNYSEDLRGLVVRKVLSGMSQQAASKTFEIHRTTISRWLSQYRKDGRLSPLPRRSYRSQKMSDDDLLSYIKKRGDATLEEISGHFNIATTTVMRRFRKLGITRKKNHVIRGA